MHRIAFLGTSEFAVPILEALLRDSRFHVDAVITQPDRPVGRRAEVTPPPVKVLAEQYHIKTFQPEKLEELKSSEEFQNIIKEIPDAFVVVAYGKILPKWFLEIPTHGTVNVHASLLPRWRGASPIHAAIAAGDMSTGVTVMKIDEHLDHGPILAQEEEPIHPDDTGGVLHGRLSHLGARILPNVLAGYVAGSIAPKEQDHAHATMCRMLMREHGKIDWNKTAHEIEQMVRAYDPWPGTWIEIDGKRLKILAVRVRPNDAAYPTGTRFPWKKRPNVKCGNGTVLELITVQPEGKKPMSGEEFLRGNPSWLS